MVGAILQLKADGMTIGKTPLSKLKAGFKQFKERQKRAREECAKDTQSELQHQQRLATIAIETTKDKRQERGNCAAPKKRPTKKAGAKKVAAKKAATKKAAAKKPLVSTTPTTTVSTSRFGRKRTLTSR